MKKAAYIQVSDEFLDDIDDLRHYVTRFTEIKRTVLDRINKDKDKASDNYAMLAMELISAKEEIKRLKKQLSSIPVDRSNYYS